MGPWGFVVLAYALVLAVLLTYWYRVERGIRALEHGTDAPSVRPRP
jgi:hypothetical protein